jgi:hypothetical protein
MARRAKRRLRKRSQWHKHLVKARRKVKKHARRKVGFGGRKRRRKS